MEPEFVTAAEGQAAAADAIEIIKRFGITHVTEEQRAFMAGQMKHLPLPKEQVGWTFALYLCLLENEGMVVCVCFLV